MGMFNTLIVVMVSQMYSSVKTYQIVHFVRSVSYVNNTSIKAV